MSLQADVRAATVSLFTAYAASAGIKLQVYPGRPMTLYPPTAFVDVISERIAYVGITLRQRTPIVEAIIVHGEFDSKEAVDQKDAFVDGFLDWVTALPHAAGANTLVAVVATEDLPGYSPEWIAPARDGLRRSYFATHITLEGYAEN